MSALARTFALSLAIAATLVLSGCVAESGRTTPGQQQGVSDVMQQQMQSASGQSDDDAVSGSFAGDDGTAYTHVDYDLTSMSPEMVYATVNDMLTYPNTYMGKVIRMAGPFYRSHDEVHGTDRYFVIVQDATACCAQGLEFVWGDGSHSWPADYPPEMENIVVTGVYETYSERTINYVHLVDASLELM